jgi:hypothetical protein
MSCKVDLVLDAEGNGLIEQVSSLGHNLVLKGVRRIEAIVSPEVDERLKAVLHTHTFSRMVRRDFNITSVKMYWAAKSFPKRVAIIKGLDHLDAAVLQLEELAKPLGSPVLPVSALCPLRIISTESKRLLSILLRADLALYSLAGSYRSDAVDRKLGPTLRAYVDLRAEIFNFPPAAN